MRTLWNEGWSFLRLEVGTELSDALGREQDFVPVDIPHDWLNDTARALRGCGGDTNVRGQYG